MRMILRENVPLAPLTTFQIGGPARYFVEASNVEEVGEAVAFARAHALPLFVLGGGSNLLISDAGWPGLVLKVGILGINHVHSHNRAIFEVGAGEDWDGFVASVVAHRLAGLECLSGIPGSVGGTPVQNIGAYGQEAADSIESVQVLDVRSGEMTELEKGDCDFRYRSSIFNTTERGRYVILHVNFSLQHGTAPHLEYGDLKKYFSEWESAPTLAETREAVLKIRASKAMLITPNDEDSRSAGSFFKNPVLSSSKYDALLGRATDRGLNVPRYPGLHAQHKISAAWLVEHSGFSKGFRRGNVGISRKHALAVVNLGGATADEIVALKEQIQQKVQEAWGLVLEPEPVFVGF
jgi:UDP-N-acetylmuramate dehydrogenase